MLFVHFRVHSKHHLHSSTTLPSTTLRKNKASSLKYFINYILGALGCVVSDLRPASHLNSLELLLGGIGVGFTSATKHLTQGNNPKARTHKLDSQPRPPNVPVLRAVWSSFDGIWGVLKGSWGVLEDRNPQVTWTFQCSSFFGFVAISKFLDWILHIDVLGYFFTSFWGSGIKEFHMRCQLTGVPGRSCPFEDSWNTLQPALYTAQRPQHDLKLLQCPGNGIRNLLTTSSASFGSWGTMRRSPCRQAAKSVSNTPMPRINPTG